MSLEFYCRLSSTVAYKEIFKEFYGRHTKVNCVLDLGCQRCPIDDLGVVVFIWLDLLPRHMSWRDGRNCLLPRHLSWQ